MSNDYDNGGPAYPQTLQENYHGDVVQQSHAGMTLRDYFAAKVLQAMLTNANGVGSLGDSERLAVWNKCAVISYELADAMLKARES